MKRPDTPWETLVNTTASLKAPAFSRYAGFVADACRRMRREMRIRKSICDLPDYLLSDIGLTRSEVVSVVLYRISDRTRFQRG
jgi:uncharacterized protein YjiS (DUF1127 family)